MWRGLLIIAVWAIATPVLASGRYFCAADDANVKLSIDAGFSEDPGHKLNHFRGALIGKSEAIPASFRSLMLESDQLTQDWAADGDLRLVIAADNGDGDAASSLELALVASGTGESAPLTGSYVMILRTPAHADGTKLDGRLTCSVK